MSVRYGIEGMTQEMLGVCQRRIEPLLREYGHQIRFITIEALCVSCYAQGIADIASIQPPQSPEAGK